MTESLLIFALQCSVVSATALIMDWKDRKRVLGELSDSRDLLKESIEKLALVHNDLMAANKNLHEKIVSMDMRITAIASNQAAGGIPRSGGQR